VDAYMAYVTGTPAPSFGFLVDLKSFGSFRQ
jgi:hypothetical protein